MTPQKLHEELVHFQDIRKVLRKFVRDAFCLSVKEYISQQPGLTRNMFFGDNKTEGKRDRGMSIETLKTVCDRMGVGMFVAENENPIMDVNLDLSDPKKPVAVCNPMPTDHGTVMQSDTFDAPSAGALVNEIIARFPNGKFQLQLQVPEPVQNLAVINEVIPPTAQMMVGYVPSPYHYDLLMEHGVYYVRMGKNDGGVGNDFFSQLPDYLVALPSQRMKRKWDDVTLKFEYPYSIRIFKIRKDMPNGPDSNEVLDRLNFSRYNPKHSHGFFYLECEVVTQSIDQPYATKVLHNVLPNNTYGRPYLCVHSALISHGIYKK